VTSPKCILKTEEEIKLQEECSSIPVSSPGLLLLLLLLLLLEVLFIL
jgi:hypothetical protein